MNSDTTILALDTSFGEISAAVCSAEGDYISAVPADHGRTRSVSIVPMLDELLVDAGFTWNQLDLLALGAGPGSFTGLRIAAATLAGINSGLKRPILHLSSLAITARQADSSDPIWVLEDARAGEAFVGRYRSGLAIDQDRCMTWAEISSEITPDQYVCHTEPPVNLPGWHRRPLTIARSNALLATALAEMEFTNKALLPRYPDPVYLQRSQAEKNIHG